MKHFQKICDGIDVEPLREQLAENPILWNMHGNRMARPNNPFAASDDIWGRYNDISKARPDFSGFNDEHVPVWYPAWHTLPALRPIVFGLMARVEGEMIGGVLITRVGPGREIKPHTDSGWHVNYFSKFYIAIDNDPGACFYCEHEGVTEELCPEPGSIWYFDNRKLHWVTNASGKARQTLIVCIRTAMYPQKEWAFG